MTISPFSFREFGNGDAVIASTVVKTKGFEINGRKKEEVAPPPPPPPLFSEEELKTAERDSYQKGFLSGITEGKNQAETTQAQLDRDLSATVENFATQLSPLFSVYREMLAQQAKMLPQMAYGIAKKVAGEALDANAYNVIEDISLRCLSSMCHAPRLVIIVHESLAPKLETKIANSLRSLQINGEIEVVGDIHIALHNCRIEWKDGAMVRDTEQLWQQIEQVVASMVASSTAEMEALCDAIAQSQHLSTGE